jgi:putative Holliday junction resolvase
MSRVLALDYGSARCGVAVSDPAGTLATPLGAIQRPRSRGGLEAIATLVKQHGAERVVVGLPLSLRGADTEQTRRARAFAATLGRTLGDAVRVELYDERLTTRMAQRMGTSPGKAGRQRVAAAAGPGARQRMAVPGPLRGARTDEDSRAAAWLLEDWLRAAAR